MVGEGLGSCYALKDYTTEETSLIALNHYLALNKTSVHSTGERFGATMAFLFIHVETEQHIPR